MKLSSFFLSILLALTFVKGFIFTLFSLEILIFIFVFLCMWVCLSIYPFINSSARYQMIASLLQVCCCLWVVIWGEHCRHLTFESTFNIFQSLSHIQLFVTPWTAVCQAPLSSTISRNLLKFMFTELVIVSNHPLLCHPLLLSPSISPSIRVFSSESALCIKWSKYWSFSFSINSSNEYSALIPLGLTGLISLLSKGLSRIFSSTTVWKHHFFSVQPSLWSNSHLCVTTIKTTALSIWTFVGKVMCLLFMLSRFAIPFLPRSQVSFNFMAAVTVCSDFGAQEKTICHGSHFLPFYLPWSNGTRCHDLHFPMLLSCQVLLIEGARETLRQSKEQSFSSALFSSSFSWPVACGEWVAQWLFISS